MNENSTATAKTAGVNTPTAMVCPICNKMFNNVIAFAEHMTQHSKEEKKRREEEEKQRKADQKKLDAARLEKLKKMYEDAYTTYLQAKEKYIDNYGEDEIPTDLSGVFDFLKNFDGWRRWL